MPFKDKEAERLWKGTYRLKHREEIREKAKLYREQHKEETKERMARWYQEHKAEAKLKSRQWYQKNKERVKTQYRDLPQEKKIRKNLLHNLSRRKNREKVRHQKLRERQNIKVAVLTHYGNGKPACVRCGFDDLRALSIDHIYGGGSKHRQAVSKGGGYNFYHWLKRQGFPEGYQSLCMNCQLIKEQERRVKQLRMELKTKGQLSLF